MTILVDRIRDSLARCGFSAREASRQMGRGLSFVGDIIEGRTKAPRGDTLADLEKLLRVPAGHFTDEGIEIDERFACPLLPVVCLDEGLDLNRTHPLPWIKFREAYLVFGEPALEPDEYSSADGGIRHYVLYDLGEGKMIPGMYHGNRFRRVTNHDDFF